MRVDRRSVSSLVFCGACAFGWLTAHGGAPTAQAQPAGKARPAASAAPDLTGDNQAVARAGYDKGRAAEKAANWQEAYTEYRAAFALYPDPQYGVALGRAALELGKHREAAQVLQPLVDAAPAKKGLSAADLAEAKKHLTAALLKVGKLQVEGPAGAEVWVDGTLVGTLPLKEEPFVDAGERDVEARRDGTVIARARATVTAGKSEPVKLIEGEGLAPAPTAPAVVEPPAPSVTATAVASAEPTSSATAVVPTATAAPVGPPPDKGGPSWAGVLALGGVAVAGIAVGAGLWVTADGKGMEARQKFDDLPSLPPGPCATPACQAVHDTLAAQAGLQTGALVAWGVGAAALVGAGVVWLATGKSPPKSGSSGARQLAPQVVPVIAGGTGGLVVQGSF